MQLFFSKVCFDTLKSIKRFKKFLVTFIVIILIILASMVLFKSFWNGKILLITGTFFILASAISNKYCVLKKDFNPDKLKDKKKSYLFWLKFEIVINYAWIIGIILLIISRWILI